MSLKRESIFLSLMLLLFFHMANGRLIHNTLPYADVETVNMSEKNAFGSRLLSSAFPRGGNYINNPHAAKEAAVRSSGYRP